MWNRKTLEYMTASVVLNFIIMSAGCEKNNPKEDLMLLEEYYLEFPEPSGLSLSYDKKTLWSVSDQNSMIYNIALDGQILSNINVNATDLEGICVISDSTLSVVSEATNELVTIDLEGNVLDRYPVSIEGESKFGLEAISYNEEINYYFILKEKNPSLFIVVNSNFENAMNKELNFSKDLSGIYYDNIEDKLWILSDENQSIYKCDLMGNPLQIYHINVSKPEGIAIDRDRKKIYIVSDSQQKLYIYQLPI